MASIGKSANVAVFLDGREFLAPRELFDIGVKGQFGEDGVQADITIEEMTFTGSARTEFLSIIENGGIFEGVEFKILATGKNNEVVAFDGFLDISKINDNPSSNECQVPLAKSDGLNNLQDRLDSITFGNLVDDGLITSSDYTTVDYVVEKPFNLIEELINVLVLYLLLKEAYDLIRSVGKSNATTAGLATTTPPGSAVGASTHSVLSVLTDILYAGLMVVNIINISRRLINTFLPPKRQHKSINLKLALEKISEYLGYEFVTDSNYLDKIYYLPSNLNYDTPASSGLIGKANGIEAGIPNQSDIGYNCGEMFKLAKDLILGNTAILDNKLYLNFKGSNFFERQAQFELFDSLDKTYRFNTEEADSSLLLLFSTDSSDLWTISNYRGTSYQRTTSLKTVKNPKNVTLKGANRVDFPVALGNRKDSLNSLERIIVDILGFFEDIVNGFGSAFGLNVDFRGAINSKIGLLKVSDNNHSIPKLLYLENGKIPANHRQLLSAKTVYDNAYFWTSFVSNAEKSQKKVFEGANVPFGIDDFSKLVENAYIYSSEGKSSKVIDFSWQMLKDRATISYFERGRYTDNLKEKFTET